MSVMDGSGPVYEAVEERHRLLVLVGFGSTSVGAAIAAYIAYDWFANGVGHEVLAVVSTALLLLGVQLLVLASLTSMLVTLHRELLARADDDAG